MVVMIPRKGSSGALVCQDDGVTGIASMKVSSLVIQRGVSCETSETVVSDVNLRASTDSAQVGAKRHG